MMTLPPASAVGSIRIYRDGSQSAVSSGYRAILRRKDCQDISSTFQNHLPVLTLLRLNLNLEATRAEKQT